MPSKTTRPDPPDLCRTARTLADIYYGRWPRQEDFFRLANAIERAVVVGQPPSIRKADLSIIASGMDDTPTGDSMSEVERAHIMKILERTGWNITRSAEILGIDRMTLYNKNKKYGLKR